MEVKGIMGLVFLVIVGVAFAIPVLTSFAEEATVPQSITNEAMTCTNATTQILDNDNVLSATFVLSNGTVTIDSGNYTLTTSSGAVAIDGLDNAIYGSSCLATYDYYSDMYQTDSSNRTITILLPVLIALALLAMVTKAFGMW